MRSGLFAIVQALVAALVLSAAAGVRAQPGATVLHIASERLTDLAFGSTAFTQVARLGFGTAQQPFHAWYGGGTDVRPLVHLPGYQPGQTVRIEAPMLIGNRFKGQTWPDAVAALRSFDGDGNGIVEGREMRDIYVWVDFDGDGTIAQRDDALRPASFYYSGFDLRAGALARQGHARSGRWVPFAVMVPYATRIHLIELDVSASFPTRHQGYLSQPATGQPALVPVDSPFSGRWRWKITNSEQWKDTTRPWGPEPGGRLMLVTGAQRLQGSLQMIGPHEDRINLPLEGVWREGRAQWTSVSPLGLTRSEVRLDSLYGYPLLRGRSWSNRNGKVTEWTWEARYEQALD